MTSPTDDHRSAENSNRLGKDGDHSGKDLARVELWIDGCGGYRLLEGTRWDVGGAAGGSADIALLSDWPRHAGAIQWTEEEYYWVDSAGGRDWLRDGEPLPVDGSAKILFGRPSPLSGSAVLRPVPPHRLAGHVDGVLLFRDTMLIGPGDGCHVRCHHAGSAVVVTRKSGRWIARGTSDDAAVELIAGKRVHVADVGMTLQMAGDG